MAAGGWMVGGAVPVEARIARVELQIDDTSQVNIQISTPAALLHACIV